MKKSVFFSYGHLLAGAFLITGLFLLSACNKDNDTENTRVPAAYLMTFNMVPDKAAGIAVTLSGNGISNQPITFTNYTFYLNIYTGERQVNAYDAAATSTPLASTSYTFNDSSYYSLFVMGANNTYSNVIVRDNFDSLATTGQAYIRFVNAIPDSSQSTVTMVAGGSTIVNASAGFKDVSDFVAATPGSVVITASNGGTINVNRTITLEQNRVYTVLLTGVPGGTGDQAVQIKYIENGSLAPGEK